jgi:hypothetical protein
MAFQLKARPKKAAPPLYVWKVLKERSRGGLIYGRRRAVGDTFQAPLEAMAQDEREAIVQRFGSPSTGAAAPAAAVMTGTIGGPVAAAPVAAKE